MTAPRPNEFPQEPDRCVHGEQQLRRRIASNGVAHFVLQCQHCGVQIRAVGPNDPLRTALTAPPPDWDATIAERYWEERFSSGRERWAAAAEERRERYQRYINSPEWRAKADQRLALDKAECQARLRGCTRYATQVHHLTYVHFENEPMFDLRSVCRSCHDQITEMDRSGRTDTGYAAAD